MNSDAIREAAMLHQELILPPYDTVLNTNNGFDAICVFSNAFSGGNIYVPSLRTIFKQCIEQEIRNKYSNMTVRALAKRYGISERYIRTLIQ